MISYEDCIAQYETEARKLAGIAIGYRCKAKQAMTYSERFELREKARMYEELSIEKYGEARILRERSTK